MKLGLETFSYHLALGSGRMDIFDFIRRTHDLGLDGVQINMVGTPPQFGHLGSIEPDHLRKIRELTDKLGLYVEIDTNGTDETSLNRSIDVCKALGAKTLRTYQRPTGDVKKDMADATRNLQQILPRCEKDGVRIAFENHEYETAADILRVVQSLDSERIGVMLDNGNGMMSWEDPDVTVETLAPFAFTSHFKDHVVIEEDGQPIVVGTTLGKGSMNLKKHFHILSQKLPWINIEVCYNYRAPFRRAPEDGGGATPGQGAFAVIPGHFDPAFIPTKGFAGPEIYEWENQSVEESVEFMKKLRAECV